MSNIKISDDFFEPEWKDGYLVRRETKQVWAVYLDLLETMQKVCESHKLRYFMGFGTLLGAFRHGGFVPWDDDVDILMPRKDFEQLKRFASEFNKPYFLQWSGSDSGYWHRGMMKLRRSDTACVEKRHWEESFNQGIGLEILPIDSLPDNILKRKIQLRLNDIFQKILWAKMYKTDCNYDYQDVNSYSASPRWAKYQLLAASISQEGLKKKIYYNQTKYENQRTKYSGILTNYGGQHLLFFTEDFADSVLMKFENLLLPAPIGFMRCLEIFYGEWFYQLPSFEHRKPGHPAFWALDGSYEEYMIRFRDVFNVKENETIVLFGTGNMVKDYLLRAGDKYKPVFYVDNNKEKWGTMFNGCPVKSPSVLLDIPQQQLHLIICNNYFREIGRQLREMGIKKYYIHIDNLDYLITDPNSMGKLEKDFNIPFRVGCMAGDFSVIDRKLIDKMKQFQRQCRFLLLVLIGDEALEVVKDRKLLLSQLRCVNRVICMKQLDKEMLRSVYGVDNFFD